MPASIRPFGLPDQIGYACGDLAGSLVNQYVDAYFMVFCTYVLGLEPLFMGSLFLAARLFDAFSAPVVGSLPDRWLLGKSGDRYKPYVRRAALPLALSGLACFCNVACWPLAAQKLWVSAAYLLYCVCYSFAAIPYGSLASVMTDDPNQRTRLSTCRSIGGMAGALCVAAVPQFVFDRRTGAVLGQRFFQVSVVFGVGCLAAYAVLLGGTAERRHVPCAKQGYSYRRVLRSTLGNRPLLGLMIAAVGSLLYITGMGQFSTYLYKEYYHQPQLVSAVMLLQSAVMLPLFPLLPRLTRRWGKRSCVVAAAGFSLVLALVLFLVPVPHAWLFLLLNALAGAGNAVLSILIWALAIDCIDYQEYCTGERNDGSVYAIFTFARKLGSAIASTLASYALWLVGYVSGAASQTEAVQARIRSLCTGLPLVADLLILIGMGAVYRLGRDETLRINAAVRARAAGKD